MKYQLIIYNVDSITNKQFIELATFYDCSTVFVNSCEEILTEACNPLKQSVVVVGIDGEHQSDIFTTTTKLRSSNFAYVIYIGSCLDCTERVRWLSMGATTYIQTPFNPQELLSRANFLLKLTKPHLITDGDLTINYKNYSIIYLGQETKVTPKVFKTLDYLIEHKGKVISRAELSQYVSGYSIKNNERLIDTYIKIIRSLTCYDMIETIRKCGYVYHSQQTDEDIYRSNQNVL